nr:uncharacterized protein LOC119167874 isoform X1 [Rhipicephalus microplus]
MRIAFVALALVAVAIVYLELQLAEGKIRMKIPKLKLKKGPKIRVPKVKKTHMHMPKAKHIAPHTSPRLDHAHKVAPIFARTKKFQNSPLSLCIIEWNPPNIAEITDPSIFNSMLQGYLHSEKHG